MHIFRPVPLVHSLSLLTERIYSIILHVTILDLFRPFLAENPRRSLQLMNFTSEQRGPEDVYAASTNQLKHLVLAFRTRYSCANVSLLWHKAMLYVIDDCLPQEDIAGGKGKSVAKQSETEKGGDGRGGSAEVSTPGDADEDALGDHRRKIWLLACLAGYRALAPQFTVAKTIFERLLNTAVLRSGVTAEEAQVLMDQMASDSNQLPQYPGRRQLEGQRTHRTMTLPSRGGRNEQGHSMADAGGGSSISNVFRTAEWPSPVEETPATSTSLITGFEFSI